MYEAHFGITGPPFQLSPDPSFYYDSKGHHDALAVLRRGLTEPRGMIVVSGEIGVPESGSDSVSLHASGCEAAVFTDDFER